MSWSTSRRRVRQHCAMSLLPPCFPSLKRPQQTKSQPNFPHWPERLPQLFSSTGFEPHGHCYLWQSAILWLHVLSDLGIALAYYSIPLALFTFVAKRRDLAYPWMFVLFGAFIWLCGTTHLMNIWTTWHGTYRLEGVLKLLTAGVSVATAALLWPLIPAAVALPRPAQLAQANQALQEEK